MKLEARAGLFRERLISYLLVAVALLGAVLLAQGGIGLWYRFNGPAIPVADTTGVDPRVVQAIDAARGNVRRRPGAADAWGHLGKVFRVHEFEPEANVCFRRAEELDPSEPRWPYLLAKGLRGKDPEAAEAAFRRASALGGLVVTPSLALGEILLEQGRPGDAEPLFLRALQREPQNPRALLALGRMAMDRGDYERAVEQLKQAALEAPEVRATHSLLAQIYGRVGEQESAAREILAAAKAPSQRAWPDPYQEEVLRVWVGLKAGLTRALALWNQGSQREAAEFLRELVKEYPDSDRAQFSLGDRLNRLQEFAEAEEPLREAVRLDPSFSRAHFELGYSVHQQGRFSEAADHYREAIRRQPDFAVAYYNLSYALVSQRDRPAAIEALRNAIRYEPGLIQAYSHLGELLTQDGKQAEAREAMRRADELAGRPASATVDPGADPSALVHPPDTAIPQSQ